jgi:hypothetical protein
VLHARDRCPEIGTLAVSGFGALLDETAGPP